MTAFLDYSCGDYPVETFPAHSTQLDLRPEQGTELSGCNILVDRIVQHTIDFPEKKRTSYTFLSWKGSSKSFIIDHIRYPRQEGSCQTAIGVAIREI